MDAPINIKLVTVLLVLIEHVRNERRLYTEDEAAYLFGVSPRTLSRWRTEGAISYVNLGGDLIRYRWEHIQSRMDECQRLSASDKRKNFGLVGKRRTGAAA